MRAYIIKSKIDNLIVGNTGDGCDGGNLNEALLFPTKVVAEANATEDDKVLPVEIIIKREGNKKQKSPKRKPYSQEEAQKQSNAIRYGDKK